MGERMTGARALIKALEAQGVEVIFGLPGGAILPVYDPLIESPIRHILVRHEQGAGHMAEGYAQATGKPGVAMVTSGPGATNIVTPIADAYMDSIPIVVITGQVARAAIGTDAFQECDTTGITMGITKHNFLVKDARELPRVVAEAFYIATTGRPGPVLIDVPKDVSNEEIEYEEPGEIDLPGYRPRTAPDPEAVRRAADLVLSSKRPVFYLGGGIMRARCADAVRELVDLVGAPAVTTLMARGAIPDSHPLCLGMPGMHGTYAAVTAMQKADLLIALGTRFDDRVTGKVSAFAPNARVIHADVDPAEIGKVRRPDVALLGDLRLTVPALAAVLRSKGEGLPLPIAEWLQTVRSWKEKYPLTYDRSATDVIKPQYVVETLRSMVPDDTILVAGVGQHQMWASQFWRFERPYTWINSGGLGTMGFAVPAGIGAKVGCPDKLVWVIDGDGCFQMTAQELVTAASERIPVKVAILNNAYLGMVRQWQHLFYEERYSEVYLSPDLPDYALWAEAMGCVGLRAEQPEEVAPVLEKAMEIDDRPVVVDFRVDVFEHVFPMVPAGASNDDIILPPGQVKEEA
jgi:acetolactate synthase-1/2/3 large subunit